jgi:hypothetical protein
MNTAPCPDGKRRPIHICWADPIRHIEVDGRRYYFEDHRQFGPIPTDAEGETTAAYFEEHEPFWRAWEAWTEQGKKVDESGMCVWAAES